MVYYTSVVAVPVGLEIIMERLTSGFYRHSSAVLHDISTIASNAVLYNGQGSPIAKGAKGECMRHVIVSDASGFSEHICRISHAFVALIVPPPIAERWSVAHRQWHVTHSICEFRPAQLMDTRVDYYTLDAPERLEVHMCTCTARDSWGRLPDCM